MSDPHFHRGPKFEEEQLHPRGTMACPICGASTPHSHTPSEVEFRRDQLRFRLQRLADALEGPRGFYNAMHKAYGTDYGPRAERVLHKELLAAIQQLPA